MLVVVVVSVPNNCAHVRVVFAARLVLPVATPVPVMVQPLNRWPVGAVYVLAGNVNRVPVAAYVTDDGVVGADPLPPPFSYVIVLVIAVHCAVIVIFVVAVILVPNNCAQVRVVFTAKLVLPATTPVPVIVQPLNVNPARV